MNASASSTVSSPASAATLPTCAVSSSSKATSRIFEVARGAVAGADYVLHQAAIPSVPRSVKDPVTSNRANIDATLNVLVAAHEARVKRVVYAASSSAYGDAATSPKREDMPTAPLSPYALQKLVGEQYMQLFTKLYGLETVSIRYFNVFGPRQDPSSPYSGVISLFATKLLDGEAPTICGDGEQTRDFTYVANVVDGVLRACTADASGEVINVATGGTISINELCRVMAQVTGVDARPVHVEPRLGDVPGLASRHLQGSSPPRLRADRLVQRRPGDDNRLVQGRARRW